MANLPRVSAWLATRMRRSGTLTKFRVARGNGGVAPIGKRDIMKHERQQAILKLVRSRDIYTQGELTEALSEAGFDVAQATVSRDIRELRLIKESTEIGLKYAAQPAHGEPSHPLNRVFRDGVVSADNGGNMLVLRTISGMAMVVALALDNMNLPEILGTVAGDDTVICVVKTEAQAAELAIGLMEK